MKMINAISPLVPGDKKNGTYVFLAGPIQGAPDWQSTVPSINNITWVNPRRTKKIEGTFSDKDYKEQVDWETAGLRISDIVLFWIPKAIEDIPGRDYAQTTKIELTENLVRGKKIILGIDPEIHGRRYLILKAKDYGITEIHDTLEGCIKELNEYLENRDSGEKFFISDTHFGSERSLELSKRPFRNVEDMDWTMIERWNKTVPPNSEVWHLGDFGDTKYIKYLNGNINLVCGNYEIKEKEDKKLDIPDFIESLMNIGFSSVSLTSATTNIRLFDKKSINIKLVHEPSNYYKENEWEKEEGVYGLFGHIHGRQKVKKFGIDVGVDSNNFTPMSEDDVAFYLNALEKGYYDNEVFIN